MTEKRAAETDPEAETDPDRHSLATARLDPEQQETEWLARDVAIRRRA